VRDTIAMSCARSQSGVPVGTVFSACSALTRARRGSPLEVVALGGGERGPARIALAVVDDAELVPGEGVGIVAADGGAKHALGFLIMVGPARWR
jgi:hypothetical protein